jgi:hypothetical protein
MFFRWKQGLSGLSTAERQRILDAEEKAKRMAVEFNCAARCVEHPIGMADCSDIRVSYSRLTWRRSSGRLLAHIFVWLTPDNDLFEAKWKLKPTDSSLKSKRFPPQERLHGV